MPGGSYTRKQKLRAWSFVWWRPRGVSIWNLDSGCTKKIHWLAFIFLISCVLLSIWSESFSKGSVQSLPFTIEETEEGSP
jgi:hypothetical protein